MILDGRTTEQVQEATGDSVEVAFVDQGYKGDQSACFIPRISRAEQVTRGVLQEMKRQPNDLLVIVDSDEYGSGTRLFGSVRLDYETYRTLFWVAYSTS
jgi:hypothetical protein